jgi:hypothetical protein
MIRAEQSWIIRAEYLSSEFITATPSAGNSANSRALAAAYASIVL